MTAITTIKPFGSEKLNNNEYGYFSTQFLALMTSATAMALHVPQSLVDAYAANVDKLTDMVSQSRIADETAMIADVDKRADDLIVYFFDALRSEKKSPIASKRDAATGLYNALKPYVGCQRLPQRQQVQSMRGMLTDLAKEPLVAHVATLALADVVEEIGHVADEYGALLEQRSESQAANDMGPVKNLRVEMDGQYDYITTMAFAFSVAEPSDALTTFVASTNFAFSVAEPSDALTTFVASTNRLIDDTNKAYNLRTGQTSDGEDDSHIVPDPEQPGDTDEPDGGAGDEGGSPGEV